MQRKAIGTVGGQWLLASLVVSPRGRYGRRSGEIGPTNISGDDSLAVASAVPLLSHRAAGKEPGSPVLLNVAVHQSSKIQEVEKKTPDSYLLWMKRRRSTRLDCPQAIV